MEKNNEMSRRRFINDTGKAALGASILPYIANTELKDNPPNIIFIICDQMRGDAIGALGNNNARTPFIDRMAKSGVMFRNNFSNNPVSLPSRVSMFSGLYPQQTGLSNTLKTKALQTTLS